RSGPPEPRCPRGRRPPPARAPVPVRHPPRAWAAPSPRAGRRRRMLVLPLLSRQSSFPYLRCSFHLQHTDRIVEGIEEPGPERKPHIGDAVVGLQARQVVLLHLD